MAKENEKPWYASKGIIGAILVMVPVILRALGQESEAGIIEAESVEITNWVLEAITFVGAALAFWGRITAKKKVTL